MQVVVVWNRKGGSGKSTTAAFLALAAVRDGWGPVAVVDTDPNTSLLDWSDAAAKRGEDLPFDVIAVPPAKAAGVIRRWPTSGVDAYRLVVVDTPPAGEGWRVLDDLGDLVDLVVVPMRPTKMDVSQMAAAYGQLDDAGFAAVALPTMVRLGTNAARDVRPALRAAGILQPKHLVRDLTLYSNAVGTLPRELGDYKHVWDELKAVLSA